MKGRFGLFSRSNFDESAPSMNPVKIKGEYIIKFGDIAVITEVR
jgi:hypothetical protein